MLFRSKATLDLAYKESPVGFVIQGVQINAENGNVLALVNPMMHKAGKLEGEMNADLKGQFTGDWKDPGNLTLKGKIGIDKLVVVGGKFIKGLTEILSLDESNVKGFMRVEDLDVGKDVVSYQKMQMKIQNTLLLFRGNIRRADGKLDLIMTAPVDQRMLDRAGLGSDVKGMIGQTVEVPVHGTIEDPKFDFAAPVKQLAQEYLKKQINKGLEDGIKNLFNPRK